MPLSLLMVQCLRETASSFRHKPLSGSRLIVISTLFRRAIVPLLAPETTTSLGSIGHSSRRSYQKCVYSPLVATSPVKRRPLTRLCCLPQKRCDYVAGR